MALAAVTPEEVEVATLVREQTSLWRDAWRRFRRNRLALVACFYLLALSVVAIVSIFWTPYSWEHIGVTQPYDSASGAHFMGGDGLGRDMLSRIMVGARVSLSVGLGSQVVVLVLGIGVGLIAGYLRGAVDSILSLIINIFYGVPDLLVALILYTILSGTNAQWLQFLNAGDGLGKIIIAISATRWMDMARLVRGQALTLREREFVEAARASGARPHRILLGHILPNSLGPIIVQGTFGIPQAILFEAFLSFLGLGIQPPTPSWGSMAADGIKAIRFSPHIVIWPSIALSITLLAFNFMGDGLRDALDPRQKR